MTKREWQDRQRQENALAKLGIGPEDAAKLRRISSSLRSSAEFRCNYPESEAAEAKRTAREERLEASARRIVADAWAAANPEPDCAQTEILRASGMLPAPPVVYFQGDPRGCALYVIPGETLERLSKLYADRETGKPASVDSFYSSGIAVYS